MKHLLERFSSVAILLALLAVAFLASEDDWHRSQTYIGLILAFGFVSLPVFSVHWSAGLMFVVTAMSCLTKFAATLEPYRGTEAMVSADYLTAYAFAYLVVITIAVVLLDGRRLVTALHSFALLAVLDSVWVIAAGLGRIMGSGKWIPEAQFYGMLNASSIDASFLAVCVPIIIGLLPWPLLIPVGAAILLTTSSTGIAGAVVAAGLYWFASKNRSPKWLAAMAIFTFLGIGLTGWRQITSSSGRFQIWREAIAYWQANLNQVFGAGAGTFWFFGPRATTHNYGLAVWMHNDWLQVLFEQGWVGFVCSVVLFVSAVVAAWKRPAIFAAIGTFGFVACLQMPLRLFLFSFLAAVLFRVALDREAEEDTVDTWNKISRSERVAGT